MPRPLPMFPLGSVLVPTAVLPLHVFEPRYRAMMDDLLAGDREFGVVLIDRGLEVGGGDVRSDLGTIARVLETEQFDDGRWAVVSVGTRRIRVVEWLEDAPYPRALVEELDEDEGDDAVAARTEALTALRRVLALATELGAEGPPATVDVADDPVTASFNVLALSPLGPLDRQRLLGARDAASRLAGTAALLEEVEVDLRARVRLDAEAGMADLEAFLADAAEDDGVGGRTDAVGDGGVVDGADDEEDDGADDGGDVDDASGDGDDG